MVTACEPQRDRFPLAAGTEWRAEARNRQTRSPRVKKSWRASSIQTPIHCAAVAERGGDDQRTMKPLPARAKISWPGVGPGPAERPVAAQEGRPVRQGGFLRERLLLVPGAGSSEDLSKPGLVTSLPPELFRLVPVCP